ncbi:protein kinase domain-containing protein [Paenibacillus harenae]|uniref:Serine/threonine protein kinase n=1 Tax=Paenibacillus harenae TaxID=306543 RepID=A0ABT9U4W8_PAEHA|nr:protein kinase [Paenibacillus harenae]MDQ0113489.1 serine/threonine protein kinase [Paenibacillus harenae]
MNNVRVCLGCMERTGGTAVCPYCGYAAGTLPSAPWQLMPGTIVNGRYLIGKVLGQGGFGITYLAWDLSLETKLAIKEYLPRDLATRNLNQSLVNVYSGEAQQQYAHGLDRFLDEAKRLSKLGAHPGIVSVRDFFKENGTAYLVMFYLEGQTFKEFLKLQGGRVSFKAALGIMLPVMDVLRVLHAHHILHRDISPENIYMTRNGQVKLLDFGAARQTVGEHSLSVVLKPGYAPEEQYRTRGKQGPWTDLYAVAATLYRAITGRVPPESLDRLDQESLVPPSHLHAVIDPNEEAVLMKALSVHASDRFQSVQQFQAALTEGRALPRKSGTPPPVSLLPQPELHLPGEPQMSRYTKKQQVRASLGRPRSILRWMRVAGGGVLLLIVIITAAIMLFDRGSGMSVAPSSFIQVKEGTLWLDNPTYVTAARFPYKTDRIVFMHPMEKESYTSFWGWNGFELAEEKRWFIPDESLTLNATYSVHTNETLIYYHAKHQYYALSDEGDGIEAYDPAMTAYTSRAIHYGYVDGDNVEDVVTAYESDGGDTYLNWRMAKDNESAEMMLPFAADGFELMDRNGDGDKEILFMDRTKGRAYIYDWDGTAFVQVLDEDFGGSLLAVYSWDLDGDGVWELATLHADPDHNTLVIRQYDGKAYLAQEELDVGNKQFLLLGRFDDDDGLDFVMLGAYRNSVVPYAFYRYEP